jgi:hypothetical protein
MLSRGSFGASFVGVLALAGSVQAQDIWGTQTPEGRGASTQGPATVQVAPEVSSQPDPNGSYAERVLAGLRQIVLRDFDGAIATLRGAAQLEPAAAVAFCHLGDAQLGKADWAEAKAAYETCGRFAALGKDSRYATLAAVGNARVAELSQASLADRRDAYVRLESATSDNAAKIMAAARLQALNGLVALDADYVQVRKRIAERAAQQPAK